ncbi:MAG: bifunctional homocysteine S-methyltransferase/methylenetetrahydrofolate reductase [Lachnospiraceae bacterium]|nr:bifunctional homocysteine S-methyltransferase/methylenetetrahydrofolate reductase [Lachnospiraceae bacterium]
MLINEYLKEKKIVADGAFGTYYGTLYETEEIPERANTEFPWRVVDIHKKYIEAGAQLIRTNTFASNTSLLGSAMASRAFAYVEENVRAGVALAKEAAGDRTDVFISGDIGPIPSKGAGIERIQKEQEEYYQIGKVMLEEGLSILSFETFPDLERILPAIIRLKKEAKEENRELFVSVCFSVNQFGYSSNGLSIGRLLSEAAEVDEIDAVGLNCGVGPGHMYQLLSEAGLKGRKYLIAMPNAGYPKLIRNKVHYDENTEYFTEKISDIGKLGLDILGGCCGTTPMFIESIAKNLELKQDRIEVSEDMEEEQKINPLKNSFFRGKEGKKLIAVELAPPMNVSDERIMKAAGSLKQMGVDAVTFPDSPSGRTRVDSILMGEKVHRMTGLNVIPHICCRDKNAIALRSQLMGAKINDISNFLVVTGDAVPLVNRKDVKSVFNFDSIGLMKIMRDMNDELFRESPITFGGAINQGRKNLHVEIERVKRKMELGASFFLSQPVFTKEEADKLRKVKEETGARILCGIMPLVSLKNALFMKNEIAGIHISDEVIRRYEEADENSAENVGVEIAREIMKEVDDFADGYYFSFPFNRVYLLERILQKDE